MRCFWYFLSNNQDHLWLALAGIGAIGTFIVACFALNTWLKEKKYDLAIENLAICNVAVQYVAALRFPGISTSEIKNEYLERLKKQGEDEQSIISGLYIYQSRRDRHQEKYENFLKLREKNWAVYGEYHDFYKFVNRVIEIDKEIMMANIRHFHAIKDIDNYGVDVFRTIMEETDPVIYSNLSKEDKIVRELEDWVEKLKKYRNKI